VGHRDSIALKKELTHTNNTAVAAPAVMLVRVCSLSGISLFAQMPPRRSSPPQSHLHIKHRHARKQATHRGHTLLNVGRNDNKKNTHRGVDGHNGHATFRLGLGVPLKGAQRMALQRMTGRAFVSRATPGMSSRQASVSHTTHARTHTHTHTHTRARAQMYYRHIEIKRMLNRESTAVIREE